MSDQLNHSSDTGNGAPADGTTPQDFSQLPVLPDATAPHVEQAVRQSRSFWDRSKILIILVALWWVLDWGTMTNSPLEPFSAATHHELTSLWWVEALFGLELIRQIHYVIGEHSRHWFAFWSRFSGFFARRTTGRMSDWTRFRVG